MSDDVSKAVYWAASSHQGDADKAGQPYILHPLRVMLKQTTDTRRIAAVLHDTVEDTLLTLKDIRQGFGEEVAAIVDAVTRRAGESYTDFIVRCSANPDAVMVKIADLEDNLFGREPTGEPQDKVAARRTKYFKARNYLIGRMP